MSTPDSYFIFSDHLESSRKQFNYYRQLGDKTIAQLSDAELIKEPVEGVNSVAIIVKHIWGNMMSRWTDFLSSDGEKEWRAREAEFEDEGMNRALIEQRWNEGWETLFSALDSINDSNYTELAYIRNQGHTITEAINRQLCHYAYHVGQIVFIGKMAKGEEWQSLSIPKGGSAGFNAAHFSKEKGRGHFTDELMDK